MIRIVNDFETYSPVPIEAGTRKYTEHPDADIVCLFYETVTGIEMWIPGMEIPELFFKDDIVLVAHNAEFDFAVWNAIGHRKYGFPLTTLQQWQCTMSLCFRYTLPGGLGAAGKIVKADVQKGKGNALIKLICVPTKEGKRPKLNVDFTAADLTSFYTYGKGDVESTIDLINKLPADALSDSEQEMWEMTADINRIGLPIDTLAYPRILGYVESFVEEMTLDVPKLTDGAVERVTQLARMQKWMLTQGVEVKNLQAPTVERLLKDESIPNKVKQLLELRTALGRSSTGKYRTMALMEHEGRVHHSLKYYGTQKTGRWAGRGIQVHNLPRASVPDPEAVIDDFVNFRPVDEPVKKAMALIRPMIKAPENKSLVGSDYSSIENRLLVWYADDYRALELFVQGQCQYRDMASDLYNVSYDDVTSGQRLMGKIIILGCGYVMGATTFQRTASDWGVNISLGVADNAVQGFRERYPKVVKMWYALKKIVVLAINNPGEVFERNGVTCRIVKCRAGNRWLAMTLRSGRTLYYSNPFMGEDKYGIAPQHFGIDPYTKQWKPLTLTPGRITENIMQATARDIMGQGLLNIHKDMKEVDLLATIHDEALAEIHNDSINDNTLDTFNHHLCRMPAWAKGLPLVAEGWIGKRYRK